MSLLRVLAIADAGSPTGFERVMRKNMDYLLSTGKYDISVGGIGYDGDPEMSYKYKVYPLRGEYLGYSDMGNLIQRTKADVVWTVQDLWNISHAVRYRPPEIPMVGYFPVDTPNLKWSYTLATGGLAAPVAYTKFGAQEAAFGVRDSIDLLVEGLDLKKLDRGEKRQWISLPHPGDAQHKLNIRLDYLAKWQNLESWNVVPHGVDRTQFYEEDKAACRKAFSIDPDAFVVGCANTNQFRKRQDLVIRAFAVLAEKVPTARLILWCWKSDERGWDLQQLARYYGVYDKTYFVHDQTAELSEAELNRLYNCMDVHVNLSGGEGWGLTSVESAQCGVAQVVPDWSATREIWSGYGFLAPVTEYRAEPKFLNTLHACCDVKATADWLIQLAIDRDLCKAQGVLAKSKVDTLPSWEETGKAFDRIITNTVANNFTPVPHSFDEILSLRKGEVTSELYRKPIL